MAHSPRPLVGVISGELAVVVRTDQPNSSCTRLHYGELTALRPLCRWWLGAERGRAEHPTGARPRLVEPAHQEGSASALSGALFVGRYFPFSRCRIAGISESGHMMLLATREDGAPAMEANGSHRSAPLLRSLSSALGCSGPSLLRADPSPRRCYFGGTCCRRKD